MLDAPRNNAHCTIPDDPEQSTYRFIVVAAKRARQLQGGSRPHLPSSSKKPTVIAMEEVRRGLRSRCAREGAAVMVADRSLELAQQTAAAIRLAVTGLAICLQNRNGLAGD